MSNRQGRVLTQLTQQRRRRDGPDRPQRSRLHVVKVCSLELLQTLSVGGRMGNPLCVFGVEVSTGFRTVARYIDRGPFLARLKEQGNVSPELGTATETYGIKVGRA